MRRRVTDNTSDVDMTPMLDIVFIMLIFFIVASSFVKESAVDMSPLTKSTESGTDKPDVLLVQLDSFGTLDVDGRMISISQLSASVEAWKIDKKNPKVVISTHQEAPTEFLVGATDQVRNAGISNIVVAPQ
ncbi:ExbD/TolR family protein [Pleionea sediminis]|uniref:ExbD/TolR family protein n=1 Tax=Pleionea sediminis TaxID=2569479 RepID=UPI001186AC9C|nr:biopolymer transporter ExbD [Pleionea sediminis]